MDKIEFLDRRDTHLVFLAASVGSGCRPCTKYHVTKSLEDGFSDEEIIKILSLAIAVRDTATRKLESYALNNFTESDSGSETIVNTDKSEIIICLASSYCINCNTLFQKYLTIARKIGISEEAISEILRISVVISDKARSLLAL